MQIGALFRLVLFLAPVLIFLFYYIATKQEEQKQDIKVDSVEFDRNFAQMNYEMSKNSTWQKIAEQKNQEIEINKQKQEELEKKSKEMMQEMENEIKDFKNTQNK